MGANTKESHHAVTSLHAVGGFLDGARLEFVDGLNCLIGGRGAGKTTALEFLRFGLGLMPDPRAFPQRHRALDALVKANLSTGRVAVEVRTKNAMRYTASREAGGEVQVRNESGVPVPVSLDSELFSADVFSQNEIEEIAVDPRAQLVLLDRFVEPEMAAVQKELEQLSRDLALNAEGLLKLDEELDQLRGAASEVTLLEEKLKGAGATVGPDADKATAAHAAANDRLLEAKLPDHLLGDVQKVVRDFAAAAATYRASADAHLAGANRSGANRDVVEALESATNSFAQAIATHLASVGNAARAAETIITAQRVLLNERHAVQDAEYTALNSRLAEEGDRASERKTLQQNLIAALSAARDQQAKEKLRSDLLAKRSDLLNRTSEFRDQRFKLRKAVASRLTERFESIRVTVQQSADPVTFKALVAETLKGSGVKNVKTADKLAEVFLPQELSRAAEGRDHLLIAKRTAFDDERARKIIDALRSDGVRYEIETVDMDDVPLIELLDGGAFKASPHLSTGQRCTTILPILLVQSERPLIVDQPEDNLDNAFIYDTVVKALEAVRGTRQVIFVTHNPNIPVLGEADRVFVFESDGSHAQLRRFGTVDDCKRDIETILEGGREAFLKRKARYGH